MSGMFAIVDPRAERLEKHTRSARGSASTIPILGLACLILAGTGRAQGVVAWGYNGYGQCNVLALPAGLTYVEIAAGTFHTVARRSDGSVVAWGDNALGQCNVLALPGVLTYVEIAAGAYHTVARLSDGSVVAWGNNNVGQCTVPVLPPGLTYVEIAAGSGHTVARRSDGSVVTWGYVGQFTVPVLPPGLTYVEIAAGQSHTVARRSDGSVVAWGWNQYGECNVPAPPPGLTYVEIAAGAVGFYTVARRSDGSVVSWGDNYWGQCNVPVHPPGLTYVEIAAGGIHAVARRSDGSVGAWGANYQGQCNVPALSVGLTYVEISAGGNHTVARTGPPIAYPGTNEDLLLLTAINAGPLSGGISNDIKNVVAGNTVTIEVVSPAGTFNSMEFLLIAQSFTTGAPPASAFPNIWMSYPGLTFAIGTYPSGPSGPVLPPGGAFGWLNVPPGLSGLSGIFQGVVIAIGSAANGVYAATDAHEIRVL